MDCALLERICHTIGMNPAIVFDNAGTNIQTRSDIHANTVIGPATVTIGESKALQELLAEKERLIQVLMATAGLKIGTKSGQE